MNHQTLIEPAQLDALLQAQNEAQAHAQSTVRPHGAAQAHTLVIVDCRFELARPDAGRRAYEQSRIPLARYAHLDEDLSGPVTADSGRHPLPDVSRLAERFSRWGIGPGTQVIAYDQANGAYASRLWWMLRWMGHRNAAVLNGGFQAWTDAGFAVESGPPAPPPSASARFEPHLDTSAWLTTAEVQRRLAEGGIALIDARGAERFAGRNETLDPVAGHVPGASNHPFTANLDARQRFLPAAELRRLWRAEPATAQPEHLVSMCGSGVTACHNLLALEIAGIRGAKLYAGSWSEWIRDPARPVEPPPGATEPGA